MRGIAFLIVAAFAATPAMAIGKIASDFIGQAPTADIVKAFNDWFEANSDTPTKIEVAEIPGFRLGTIAKVDIAAEELYLDIPWSLLINEDSIAASDAGKKFKLLHEKYKLDVTQTLLFFLLHERYRPEGSAPSFWKPFIDILPASFNLPLYWPDADLARLDGTGVASAVRKLRSERRASFEKYRAVVEDNPSDPEASSWGGLFAGSIFSAELRAAFDFELYDWAHSVLDSRTIWIDGRHRCFVPMLDMVNCRDHPTRKHFTSRNRATGRTNTKAIWSARAGEQVFENYATSNFDNLAYHGFVLEQNSFDKVPLALTPDPPRAVWPLLGRARAQRRYDVTAGTDLARTPVLAHARVMALTEDEAQAFLKDDAQRFDAPLNDANEAKARALVAAAAEKALAPMAGLADEAGEGATANARTAAVFVGQQRRIWQSLLAQVAPAAADKEQKEEL